MRYPGPHRHERVLRTSILSAALLLFLIGLLAAIGKESHLTRTSAAQLSRPSQVPTVSAAAEPTTTLRLFSEQTKQPLSGRSVAVMTDENSVGQPPVLTADAAGRVTVPRSLLRARPKLYVTGYKLDTYFVFPSAEKPDQLLLYTSVDGAKLVYDIAVEEVPIWLKPAD